MSLIIDCSKCAAGTTPRNDEERDWLQKVGFGAVVVKLDTITTENVDEWVFRFRLAERVWPDMAAEPLPVAAIRRWIGLRANVAPVPRPEWVSGVAERASQDVLGDLQHELSVGSCLPVQPPV
jgi:hypothetical protein